MRRFWWAMATGGAVAVVLSALLTFELLVLGPSGASASEAVTSHLFVAAVAAVAAAAATGTSLLGKGAGTSLLCVLAGTTIGGIVAVLLAVMTGNGPDEGDGFFWLTVASLVVSLVAASVAVIVASRVRP